MLQELIDFILENVDTLGGTFNEDDVDALLSSLNEQGVDLSNYTSDEIQSALDEALNSGDFQDNDSIKNITESNDISFLGSDKSWLESELRTAKHNAEYYRNELKNPNISSTFRSSCEFKLEQALKKIAEITEKLSKLKN